MRLVDTIVRAYRDWVRARRMKRLAQLLAEVPDQLDALGIDKDQR